MGNKLSWLRGWASPAVSTTEIIQLDTKCMIILPKAYIFGL